MPNIITHALCAHDVLQLLKEPEMLNDIHAHPRLYSTASSGPDFLFYYKAYPFQDAQAAAQVHSIGESVHREQVNAFYTHAIDVIRAQADPRTKAQWISFIAGHLTHWSLDSCAHPFVFYRSGEMKGDTRYWHYRYESMLDTLMVQTIKRMKLTATRSYEMVHLKADEVLSAAHLYQSVVKQVYSAHAWAEVDVYAQSFRDMMRISRWLFDPQTRLFPWVQRLEKRLKQDWNFSSHMVIGDADAQHDVLNLNHSTWLHPSTADPSTLSFVDLYEQAIVRAKNALEAFNDVIYHEAPKERLLNVIKNRSYDTGLSELVPMRHYGSVYEVSRETL
jgi:hypothetical protein